MRSKQLSYTRILINAVHYSTTSCKTDYRCTKLHFYSKIYQYSKMNVRGSLAQLVEQRPEEPCVPSSSLGGATKIVNRCQNVPDFIAWNVLHVNTSVILVSVW